jgi:hypothetical protein
MWVTTGQVVEVPKPSSALVLLSGFTHNFSHRLKGLNSPLTWGYNVFPQIIVKSSPVRRWLQQRFIHPNHFVSER